MIFTTQHPGSWKQFMTRSDNRNLPIMEARQKYLKEQLEFENQYSTYMMWQNMNRSQGGPSGTTPASTPEVEMLTESGDVLVTENNDNLIL